MLGRLWCHQGRGGWHHRGRHPGHGSHVNAAVPDWQAVCRFGHWCLDGSGVNKGGVAGIIVAGILAMAVMGTLIWLCLRQAITFCAGLGTGAYQMHQG